MCKLQEYDVSLNTLDLYHVHVYHCITYDLFQTCTHLQRLTQSKMNEKMKVQMMTKTAAAIPIHVVRCSLFDAVAAPFVSRRGRCSIRGTTVAASLTDRPTIRRVN
jgi:hypothetical protein